MSAQNPWINEIHYDNVGSDVQEVVEIVIPDPGCPTITVERYNGATGLSYGVSVLDGISGDVISGLGIGCLTNYSGGFYTIMGIQYPPNGLQNGPDGIAIQCGNGFVQFLTYEGSFTALDGIAAGMTGVDIGVAEENTETYLSAQLVDTGSVYSNFTWVIGGNSFCSPNYDQLIVEATCMLHLDTVVISCNAFTEGTSDSVVVVVPYTGSDPDIQLSLTVNDMPVPNLGDDPVGVTSGNISFVAAEGDDYVVTFLDDCSEEIVFGTVSAIQCKPNVRLSGDLFLHQSIDGVILKSPSGNCFRISVSDTGVLSTTQVSCPED